MVIEWQESEEAASAGNIIVLIFGIVGIAGTILAAGYFAYRGRRN